MALALALAEATDLHGVAFRAERFKSVIAHQLAAAEEAGTLPAWEYSATDAEADSDVARASSLLMLALPGAVLGCHTEPSCERDGTTPRIEGESLAFYRSALTWRTELQTFPELDWEETADPRVLHFSRPHGWHSVTNFGSEPVRLPEGIVVVTSRPTPDGILAPATTAWLLRWVD
ncbi:hypothetical protein [Sinomonas sp. ASV322]|uniref:hypothetical protein n=1 Tax=Sinomonas sp. ASV322 TaxID=3041920 RepID=UPI0027DB0A1C|nr:hypothetical protein [Sinomonas sp. ASV322]MDQ4503721.1 hypothetical protein [Sinomonas sp. ASV322]